MALLTPSVGDVLSADEWAAITTKTKRPTANQAVGLFNFGTVERSKSEQEAFAYL